MQLFKHKYFTNLIQPTGTQSVLGHLSFLMTCITNGAAQNELSKLASPMRQLYYLAGLMMTDEDDGTNEIQFSEEDWQHIVNLLVQITTVPLKWTNRSLKSLKLSHLRVVLGVHGFEFVPLQPN